MGSDLDDTVIQCLESLHLHIARELPSYVTNHAGILGNYIRLPIPEDIIDAIATMYKRKGAKCFQRFHTEMTADSKRVFRRLCAKMEASQITAATRRVILRYDCGGAHAAKVCL